MGWWWHGRAGASGAAGAPASPSFAKASEGGRDAARKPSAEDVLLAVRGSTAAEFPAAMHRREATGPPLGGPSFEESPQAVLARTLLPQKRGAKPKDKKKPKRN